MDEIREDEMLFSSDEMVDAVSEQLLTQNLEAYLELAK